MKSDRYPTGPVTGAKYNALKYKFWVAESQNGVGIRLSILMLLKARPVEAPLVQFVSWGFFCKKILHYA